MECQSAACNGGVVAMCPNLTVVWLQVEHPMWVQPCGGHPVQGGVSHGPCEGCAVACGAPMWGHSCVGVVCLHVEL